MKKGFFTIMAAQFFSSLADNAIFMAAIELMKASGAPEWQRVALVPLFAVFYVVLAPFVGAFADSMPKGTVMFYSNGIKIVGCLLLLFGAHPLLAYSIVGLGAAVYSPAKYGILTELLPPSQLVKANGWIEGLTIGSIILGVVLGGQLLGKPVSQALLSLDLPFISTSVDSPAEAAIVVIAGIYLLAAMFNLRIPLTGAQMRPVSRDPVELMRDFQHCNRSLWNDKLGQISLATTTLFWGVSGNLRYIVLAWAALALGYDPCRGSCYWHGSRSDLGFHADAPRPCNKRVTVSDIDGLGDDRHGIHRQFIRRHPLPDFLGRHRRLFGCSNECSVAASRSQSHGCGPIHCSSKFQ
jgi:MFS transporter, LPLT family, lysophospholipid transporter